jgi:hypothetical protein
MGLLILPVRFISPSSYPSHLATAINELGNRNFNETCKWRYTRRLLKRRFALVITSKPLI